MPTPFRLAAVDLDDTLLGPEKQVSPANRRALGRLATLGCRVVLASGRRHENMARFYRELGLDDFAVSCQGARVQHVGTGEVLHAATVSAALAGDVRAAGLALALTVVVWSPAGIFVSDQSAWSADYSSQTGGEPLVVDAGGAARGAAEKLVWIGEPARVAAAAAQARARYGARLAVTAAHDWCLELAHPAATKAAGVAAVAARAGIRPAQVVAFGDGYNDIPLLQWAGLGIAMPHGRESARRSAHRVGSAGEPGDAFARAVAEIPELGPSSRR